MLEEGGGLVHDDHVGVVDVVSLQRAQSRVKFGLLKHGLVAVGLGYSEGGLDCMYEFIVVDFACCHHVDVVPHVVFVMVVFDHFFGDSLHVADIPQNG